MFFVPPVHGMFLSEHFFKQSTATTTTTASASVTPKPAVKPPPAKPSTTGFGDQFKLGNKWECPGCCLRHNADVIECPGVNIMLKIVQKKKVFRNFPLFKA